MGRRGRIWKLAAAVALVPGVAVAREARADDAGGWQPRPAEYPTYVALRDEVITMSDGEHTYADVFLPSFDGVEPAPGPFPTILMITPYNKGSGQDAPREHLIQRGYAYVLAETRGTGSSEGTWDFASDLERHDGYTQVEWAAAQPWSTGAVGMIGDSYRGMNQWWTAMEQPPHLRAIMPINAPTDMYRTGGVNGGEVSTLVAVQGLVAIEGLIPSARYVDDPRRGAQILSTRPLAFAHSGLATADIAAGGRQSFDNDFYRARSAYWNLDRVQVPAFVVGGWYDIAQRDTPLMFQALRAHGIPTRMVVGSWTHTNYGSGLPAETLPFSLDDLALRWFDAWLLGDDDPAVLDFGPVLYQRQGEGDWHTAEAWPPPDVAYDEVFLGADGLSFDPPTTAEAPSPLPWHPASGACSRSAQQALIGLPPDSPCTDDGSLNDQTGLVFDLPASETDRRIAGPIAAHLYVSTTGSDAFVDVRVESVAPDGAVTALTDGIDTLSFRALDPERTVQRDGVVIRPFHPYTEGSVLPVAAGDVVDWWIEVLPTAAAIPAGHRLRITIQPSDALQSVMSAERLAGMAGSVLSIYHDAEHPSSVVVPFQP